MDAPSTRMAVVWCPHWPIVVACRDDPSLADRAVIVRERIGPRDVVRSASARARARGVVAGMRLRAAQACCEDHVVLDADVGREAAVFEVVARALEQLTPRIEIHRPGSCAFATRGPARYFGGDAALAERVRAAVEVALAGGAQRTERDVDASLDVSSDVRVGIADGELAARLAARRNTATDATWVVPASGSADFLAPMPVRALRIAGATDDLVELLERLGLMTIGSFAALPEGSVLARFDTDVLALHRRARGLDDEPHDFAVPPADLVELVELDPPVTRVDEAAFAAKSLADRLTDRLATLGLACTRVVVEAETEHGETLARTWRHEGALGAAALAERVRWQLDGWLRSDEAMRTRAGAHLPEVPEGDLRALQDAAVHAESFDSTTGVLRLLRLVPDEVVPAGGRQLGFWGGDEAAGDRADRVLHRVQAMLGPRHVLAAVEQGGRTPAERVRWLDWGEPRVPARSIGPTSGPVTIETPPWPGTVPGPAPARVFDPPIPAELTTVDGAAVLVNGRGEANGAPAVLTCAALQRGGGRVVASAGPWAHDVRWWDLAARRRTAWWQVVIAVGDFVSGDRGLEDLVPGDRATGGAGTGANGSELACLVSVSRGRAAVAAVYD